MTQQLAMDPIYVGIDAGGTKTRLAYKMPHEESYQTFDGPGVNIQRDGLNASSRTLVDLIQKIPEYASHSLYVCAGVAGASDPALQKALETEIDILIPDSKSSFRVVTDADIAFRAAFGDSPGILIIVGTGSIIWARDAHNMMHRAGGWGYLLGDEGGAYRLGLAGLKAVVDEMDGGITTELRTAFCNQERLCSKEDYLNFVYRNEKPIQLLAPTVLEIAAGGDSVAKNIVRSQVLAIATRFDWLKQRVDVPQMRIALAGGLSKNSFYRDLLIDAIKRQHEIIDIFPVSTDSAEAALEWAQEATTQQFSGKPKIAEK